MGPPVCLHCGRGKHDTVTAIIIALGKVIAFVGSSAAIVFGALRAGS